MKTNCLPVFMLFCLALLVPGYDNAQDLTVLDNYPNPFGNTCSVDGNPNSSPAKKARNRLKNRFEIPQTPQEMRFDEIVALPPDASGAAPGVSDPNHTKAVTVVGFVRGVYRGGTGGESCNCKATGSSQVDTHIDLVLSREAADDPAGTGVLVVEVTERSRRLAKAGLLSSNIGNNWSNSRLHSRLLNKWVKFTGWLFYDDDHHSGSWRVDPENRFGESNWRATGWELHPVMGIEVLEEPPGNLPLAVTGLNTLINNADNSTRESMQSRRHKRKSSSTRTGRKNRRR